MPKLKQLEAALQQVDGFAEPKIVLEQYPTPAHIAAHMLFTMESNFGDLANRRVLDLGCGCGMLSIGAAMFDCGQVVAIDVDTDALATAVQNAEEFELNIDFLQADLGPGIPSILSPGSFDTVVMNPPFGTKNNAGIDMVFLRRAWQLSSGAVYSLHKTTTREHIQRKAAEAGIAMIVLAQLRYDIPNMYKFHKKPSVDIKVDFLRFDCSQKHSVGSSETKILP